MKENLPKNKEKIYFKDFLALCIASFQILLPIFIIVFLIFSILAFLVVKVWVK
ncbi:membrane protein [Clostridium acetobutylicum]|nr:membrane protein [Clostridium acetobutylicum]